MDGMLSPADVAVLSGNARNNDYSGFGDNGAWWIILFLIFGWGRNGFGGNGGFGGSGVGENYILATDFANLERKLDGINNGICDSTFALNNTINSGFFGVQNALCQGFSGINQGITTNGYETRNAISDLGYRLQDCCCQVKTQLADCCCGLEKEIMGINYNLATNTNALQQTLCNSTRDIIDNQNANYRALHEEIVANKIEAKNERIAEQQNEINALRLRASQVEQNAYLVSQLGTKCPEPAYIVPNPNCCYNYGVTGFGYNNGNCCGNY